MSETPRRTLRKTAEHMLQSFESRGIRVATSSRLAQMAKLLMTDGVINNDHPKHNIAVEAFRDIQVLGFVADHLSSIEPRSVVLEKLSKVIKDPALPEDNQSHSPGRDVQFELLVAAICANAGLNPTLEEPDIACDNGYGIAVKRIKNHEMLERRIREGAKQVQRSGRPGCVVIDTAAALNPNNERVVARLNNEALNRAAQEEVRSFLRSYGDKLQSWTANCQVEGLVVVNHGILCDLQNGWEFHMNTSLINFSDQSDFVGFAQAFQRGLPNAPRPNS